MMVYLIAQIATNHLNDMTTFYFTGKHAIIIKVCLNRMNLPALGKEYIVEVKRDLQNENLNKVIQL